MTAVTKPSNRAAAVLRRPVRGQVAQAPAVGDAHHPESLNWPIAISGALAGLLGIGLAYVVYMTRVIAAAAISDAAPGVYRTLYNKYYFDEFYDRVFVKPAYWFAENIVYKLLDQGIIDGILHVFGPLTDGIGSFVRKYIDLLIVNQTVGDGSYKVTQWFGHKLRVIQTGRIQQYLMFALVIFITIGAVLYFFVLTPDGFASAFVRP